MRFTHRTAEKIMELLRRRSSMKDIAKDTGTSVSGVKRVLGIMPVSKPQRLPQALSFDEFKGDTGRPALSVYRRRPSESLRVRHPAGQNAPDHSGISSLLPQPGRSEVRRHGHEPRLPKHRQDFLPNAQIIIDRFHVVRCCTEAMENARRSFQASLPKEQRRYFKRSRRLLLAHRDRLSEEDRTAVDVMLRFSDRLLQAYALKEAFYHFMDAPDRPTASRRLDFWLDACDRLELPEFKSCRKTLVNWKPYILNAFDFRLYNKSWGKEQKRRDKASPIR